MFIQNEKRTEQEIRDALRKIDNLNKDNLSAAGRCITEWINNGYELNTTFQFSTKFKHTEIGGTFFPWEFSLLEWVSRFGNAKKLTSLKERGLNPKFKCGGRSAFQVVLQTSAWTYSGQHERLKMQERVKALLDIGAEKNIVDPSGRMPLDYLLRVVKCDSLTGVDSELKQLLKGFLPTDIAGVKVKSTWDLQNENAALKQLVAQLQCEKEELVKTTLTETTIAEERPAHSSSSLC